MLVLQTEIATSFKYIEEIILWVQITYQNRIPEIAN